MVVYYAGSSIRDVDSCANASVLVNTAYHDSHAGESIDFNGLSTSVYKQLPSALTEFWCSFMVTAVGSGTNGGYARFIRLMSGTSTVLDVSFNPSGSGAGYENFQGDINRNVSGTMTAFTGGANIFSSPAAVKNRFAIYFKLHATDGVVRLYKNGALIFEFLGNTQFNGFTSIDGWGAGDIATFTSMRFALSEVVFASVDTRDAKVVALNPTGAGNYSQWTGAYTDTDETGYDDTDLLSSGTADQITTFIMSDISAYTGWDVLAVVSSSRCRKGGTGPQNLQHLARISSTDYASASVSLFTTALRNVQTIWDTNPATAGLWTVAAVNGAELGIKSIT